MTKLNLSSRSHRVISTLPFVKGIPYTRRIAEPVRWTAEINIQGGGSIHAGGVEWGALMEVAQLVITPAVMLSAFIFFRREAKNGREELRNDLKNELKEHRKELKDEIGSVRMEVAGVRNEISDVRNDIHYVRKEIHDMNGRLWNVEGILTTLGG
ncbi:MAG: hypothetical protein OXH56_11460 [Gemmatimonadetes bacterium]|nr:hypothetical protein [Gemmatimonadota bacterium]